MAARRVHPSSCPAQAGATARQGHALCRPDAAERGRYGPADGADEWVKFIVALFLLPICAVLSQTFFTAFARATVAERLWAGEEFWFFSLGVVLWLIAFFGLPRPIVLYVFGHELTHALWVWLMGGRVSRFQGGPRRRSHRDGQAQFSRSRSRPIFSRSTASWSSRFTADLSSVLQHAAVWPAALRARRRDLGVSFHFHLLDDPEKPDRPERSRHIFFAGGHLPDQSAVA